MADIYVDSTKADDSGDGLSWANAKKHISAALGILSDPISSSTTIHLKGTVASPQEYVDSTDEQLVIQDLRTTDGATLTIEPEDWSDSNYEDDDDPFNEGGTWDPTCDKPCAIPPLIVSRCEITIKGVSIELDSDTDIENGIYVADGGSVSLHYSTVEKFEEGAGVSVVRANATVANSYLSENKYGVASAFHSDVMLWGTNYIDNSEKVGVLALSQSGVHFNAWFGNLADCHTSLIRTSAPRKNYAGIRAIGQSNITIEENILTTVGMLGHVKILNEHLYNSPEHYGVELDSASLLLGMSRISFRDSTIRDGLEDTIPAERQIVGSDNSTIVD